MNQTKGLILVTVIVTAVTTFVREATKGKVEFRSFIGASFMGIFLTGIGMVNVRLARNFCLLIIFGVLLKDKGGIFKFAGQASSQGFSKVASSSKAPNLQTPGVTTKGAKAGQGVTDFVNGLDLPPVVAPPVDNAPSNASLF